MSSKSAGNLIGANEDMFLKAFDLTPKLNIITQKKLENELTRVVSIISNPNAEWDKRVQAIKDFRSLVNSGLADSDDFHTTTLKSLEIPFQNNICDLRSQVVRETCITIAFLSCKLQQKFSRMAEIILPSLIKLIPNCAKIMSTSALVALRFIIQSTHNSRLITIIKYQLSSSKSKDIHRALCEIAERIVTLWSPNIIERQLNDLMEVLRLGICNSDELARQYARRAFNVFAEHFSEPADRLFNSLDQQRQRMLNNLNHGGGSTLSMNNYGGSITSNLHTASQPASITNHSLISRLKCSIPTTPPRYTPTTPSHIINGNLTSASPSRIRTPTTRSRSAIDEDAQRRAKARARTDYLSSMYKRPQPPPKPSSPNVVHPPQQAAPAETEKQNDIALSKTASYLLAVISNNSIAENQIVSTIKYFISLIEKHPYEVVIKLLPELMPPLVMGIDNPAICVRKASVFAMVAIHSKVGLNDMESYLVSLTMTQRKLLEVYIKKKES